MSNLPDDYQQVIGANYHFVYPNDMTLRDYFAAAAMQGNLAAQSEEFGVYTADGKSQALLCRESYAIADAMLEARKL